MASNNNNYQVPDLASVLQTLASLAPQTNSNNQYPPAVPPSYPNPTQSPYQYSYPAASHHEARSFMPSANPPEQQQQKGPDSTTITDWSAGLRAVMKTVAANESIIKEVRRMIQVQHEHEEQWFKGREALKQKLEARKEGQKKLDEVLKAVGGAISASNGRPGPEDAVEELKTFDMKIYRAQHQMVKEFSTKLKNLGIPFFGTRGELVIKGGSTGGPAPGTELHGVGKCISEKELVELQRKMLSLLEEMCQE